MIDITSDGPLGGPQFTLTSRFYTYSIGVFDRRFLTHLYWGAPLAAPPDPVTAISPFRVDFLPAIPPAPSGASRDAFPGIARGFTLDALPQEYPAWGAGEHRAGAFSVRLGDGSNATRLEYRGHEVTDGMKQPSGMELFHGNVRGRCGTLRVRLGDPRGDYTVDLFYVFAEELPGLMRWARFTNTGDAAVVLEDPASASVDFDGAARDVVTLHGSWARERHVYRRGAGPDRIEVGSRNGASGLQTSPVIVLAAAGATEHRGSVHGLALGYSGNFTGRCDGDQFGASRVRLGIGGLRALLSPGESFDTPPAVLVTSEAGFSGLSGRFHAVVREGIIPPRWRREPRRIVINSWEAMYFDVDAARIVALAQRGREIGAELLVLDDGWFSRRRDETSSLGDWWYNRERFPDGIGAVGDAVRDAGLEFGLWMEPEMVSPDSDLYRAHPEWALHVSGRESTEGRNQLILDLANPAVVEWLFTTIGAVLDEARPTHVKWDMNRTMTEAGSSVHGPERQGEVMHRYILGLYRLLERLTGRFPDILFEACASGGGRFDLGLARFSPRFWTSDQTDAVERLPIQYGTSLVFPPEIMGAHVSTVPNHQVGRVTSAWTRAITALPFSFGFELDPATESADDIAVYRQAAELYRRYRDRFFDGRFVRLRGPLAGSIGGADYAWMIVSRDGREVFVFYYQPLRPGTRPPGLLPLAGLSGPADRAYADRAYADGAGGAGRPADARGRTAGSVPPAPLPGVYRDEANGRVYDVVFLETRGLPLPEATGDYQAVFYYLVAQ